LLNVLTGTFSFKLFAVLSKTEFLEPLSITVYRMAKDLNVSTSAVLDILNDRRKLSKEMALKLS